MNCLSWKTLLSLAPWRPLKVDPSKVSQWIDRSIYTQEVKVFGRRKSSATSASFGIIYLFVDIPIRETI